MRTKSFIWMLGVLLVSCKVNAAMVSYSWEGVETFNSGAAELNSPTATGSFTLDDSAPLIYQTANTAIYSACKAATIDLGGVTFSRVTNGWDTNVTTNRLGFEDLVVTSQNYSGNSGNLFLYVNGDFQDQAIAHANALDAQTGPKTWAMQVYDLGTHAYEQVQGTITKIVKTYADAYGIAQPASTSSDLNTLDQFQNNSRC